MRRPTVYFGAIFSAAFLWSAIAPYDRLTWWLDVLPALGAALLVIATGRGYPLTPLAYRALLALCLIILIGAHYGFARVPAFDWLRDALEGSRNDFDKFAHFFQGFTPALVLRELLIRLKVIAVRVWLAPIVLGLSLSVSAAYELVEWGAAWVLGGRSDGFIADQGDRWDAQSDMAMALFGAGVALVSLSRRHDRQLRTADRWVRTRPVGE